MSSPHHVVPLRVALVCPYDPQVPGGVQTQVLGLARSLAATGDSVLVVAPGMPDAREAARVMSGASGPPIATTAARFALVGTGKALSIPTNGSRAAIAPFPPAWVRTRRALTRFRPDVVHVHEPFVPGPSFAAVTARQWPRVVTFHRGGAGLAYRIYGRAVASALGSIEARFAVSVEARATARMVLGPRAGLIELAPNGVDLEASGSVQPTPTDMPTLVFVGRHEERKGLAVLLAAFEQLGSPARLWIVGEGPETAKLEARYSSDGRIEFLGRLDDEARAARVAGADIYVAPSLFGESFGVVLLEAMAAGTAVVASDLAGYREAAGGAAELVPPKDARALATCLAALLGDAGRRAVLVERGRRRAESLSMSSLAKRYRETYMNLSKGPRDP